jgi:hypothetical protein
MFQIQDAILGEDYTKKFLLLNACPITKSINYLPLTLSLRIYYVLFSM